MRERSFAPPCTFYKIQAIENSIHAFIRKNNFLRAIERKINPKRVTFQSIFNRFSI
jgi:hypothetical protein